MSTGLQTGHIIHKNRNKYIKGIPLQNPRIYTNSNKGNHGNSPRSCMSSHSTVLGIRPASLCSSMTISWSLIVCQSAVSVRGDFCLGTKERPLHSGARHYVEITKMKIIFSINSTTSKSTRFSLYTWVDIRMSIYNNFYTKSSM